MALYPDVQKKAQEELDRVIGPNKLPSFADRSQLPYIEAIVNESLRWHPVAPMGLPHMCTEDDGFNIGRVGAFPRDAALLGYIPGLPQGHAPRAGEQECRCAIQ